jgi:hypothetical protein
MYWIVIPSLASSCSSLLSSQHSTRVQDCHFYTLATIFLGDRQILFADTMTMALFSRKKSKAKKASKEEEKKAAAVAKSPVEKPPQRGRNGKVIVPASTAGEKTAYDIPAPSQLPRQFQSQPNRALPSGHGRGYSFDQHNHTEDDKDGSFYPHAPRDSGYVSLVQGSGVHARADSTQQARRDRGYLSVSKKSMPQLTLGEELAHEPVFMEQLTMHENVPNDNDVRHHQSSGGGILKPSRSLQMMRDQNRADDRGPQSTTPSPQYHYQHGRQQRLIQQSMPMRPSSVPAQALQPRHQRVGHPQPQRSLSPGPVLQNAYTPVPSGSHARVPAHPGSPFDLESSRTPERQPKPSLIEPQSPTSPTASNQEEFSPSLNILDGLKVNKRGLILDEEGDPIGELFEGDIIDCVRQKADSHGDVLDEYGRVVGRVRTLSVRSPGTSLYRSGTISSYVEQHRVSSPPPPVPALRSAVQALRSDEDQQIDQQQPLQTSSLEFTQRYSPPSPTEAKFSGSRHDHAGSEGYMPMAPSGIRGREEGEQNTEHQELSAPRHMLPESSVPRSESLLSIPKSHSTAEIALSDVDSMTSGECHRTTTDNGSEPVSEDAAGSEQVFATERTVHNQNDTTMSPPPIAMNTAALPGAASTTNEQSRLSHRQTGEQHRVASTPPFNRSISEQGSPTVGWPPVPAVPRNFLESKKPVHTPSSSLQANPNRFRSTPLPAFPGRVPSVGLAGGNFNGPMPGLPNRRFTSPAVPKSSALGMPGLNAHSPLQKGRTSTPLVRSPLSSHGKYMEYFALQEARSVTNVPINRNHPTRVRRGRVETRLPSTTRPPSIPESPGSRHHERRRRRWKAKKGLCTRGTRDYGQAGRHRCGGSKRRQEEERHEGPIRTEEIVVASAAVSRVLYRAFVCWMEGYLLLGWSFFLLWIYHRLLSFLSSTRLSHLSNAQNDIYCYRI